MYLRRFSVATTPGMFTEAADRRNSVAHFPEFRTQPQIYFAVNSCRGRLTLLAVLYVNGMTTNSERCFFDGFGQCGVPEYDHTNVFS
jgi:hypothetical protein